MMAVAPTTFTGPLLNQSAACEAILRALPDWFGVEEAIQEYARAIDSLPTFLASRGECVIGFLTVKVHNPYAAELYVMGILPEAHRQGLGRRLVSAAEAFIKEQGIEYFQVKTLGPSRPDPGYANTRAFYQAAGFRPLEEFPLLWDKENPCLLMVKKL
jgi:ribosomal protein S18 acetylase RimI-like enzyme